jgi:hypothetical protein
LSTVLLFAVRQFSVQLSVDNSPEKKPSFLGRLAEQKEQVEREKLERQTPERAKAQELMV